MSRNEAPTISETMQEVLKAINECAVEVQQSDGTAAEQYANTALKLVETYRVLGDA